jgi:hypothetical protein
MTLEMDTVQNLDFLKLFPEFCAKKNVDTKKIAPAGGKVLYRPLKA